MPAVMARSILPKSGRRLSRQGERLDAAGEVVERDQRAALAVRVDQALEQVAVGVALGADELEADRATGRRPSGCTTGQVVRSEDSMSSTARGSRLTNRSSPSGSSGRPISSAAARARESKEKRASCASAAAISSPPRQLEGAELAAHQRFAPVGRAVGEVDDRLEVRRHDAVREELGEPVGARAVEQRVGRERQALLVGEAHREQAGALGVRDRVQQLLEAVVPARAGELQALDGDVAVDGLGRQVLDLVEHGGTVRQESHAVGAGWSADPGSCPFASARSGSALARRRRADSDLVDGALAGDLDRPAELASASPRAQSASSSSEKWVSTSRRAPALRPCSPASPGVRWPRGPSRSGRGSVASIISRSVPCANVARARRWRASRRRR